MGRCGAWEGGEKRLATRAACALRKAVFGRPMEEGLHGWSEKPGDARRVQSSKPGSALQDARRYSLPEPLVKIGRSLSSLCPTTSWKSSFSSPLFLHCTDGASILACAGSALYLERSEVERVDLLFSTYAQINILNSGL